MIEHSLDTQAVGQCRSYGLDHRTIEAYFEPDAPQLPGHHTRRVAVEYHYDLKLCGLNAQTSCV